MKTIKSISPEANQLREKFQNLIVKEYINSNGSLKGYKGQIYLLLPKYDKRIPLYKGVSKSIYEELRTYLSYIQSQRKFNNYVFSNELKHVRDFANNDFSICFRRVWHNGTTCNTGKHWEAQAAALLDGVKNYGFTFYDHDYNFSSRYYEYLYNANPLLKSIYTKILDRNMSINKVNTL